MSNPWNLTPRQAEIISLLISGAAGCNKTVARFMSISPSTVDAHMQGALRKMHAPNRIQACLAYDRWLRKGKQ